MASALQLFNVFAICHALAVARQTMPEHVSNENNIDHFTHRAHCFRRLTKMFCCANEFWMGITHRITTDASALDFIDQRTPSELVVDNSDVTSQHVDGKTHEGTR